MHGRSSRPGSPVLVVPATVPLPPIPAVPAGTPIPGRRSAAETPRAPGERTTSPGATGGIAGIADERTALEREFVGVGHHPERFIEDPRLDAADDTLRGRLRALRSHPG